ncbi:MAG TPA: chromosomal replication initiator DnaA, partial [Acetobacteraceae bacterium]|nr:chromosomal replication initiator DnaA [Acetobacteraceae bacterium]
MRQLPLPFVHRPDFAELDFVEAASNTDALAWLRHPADWPCGRLALWGEAGCGKTHLLHLWAGRSGARYVCGPVLRPELSSPAMALAIDQADAVTDEACLLHRLNFAAEERWPVLLAARTPPAHWAVRLPDLASRLRAITAVEIGRPEEALLRALLAKLLSDRQLAVSPAVQDWLLLHLPRTPAAVSD